MIRILLISYYFPPCNASGSRRWGNIFEQLRLTKNVDIKVLAPNWYGSKKRKDVFNIGPIIYYTPPKSIIEKKILLIHLNTLASILGQFHMKLYLVIGKI